MSADGAGDGGEPAIPVRGRARSGALHTDLDDELSSDLEALHAALEGKEAPSSSARRAAAAAAEAEKARRPSLSRKTINVLTRLDEATKTPAELMGERSAIDKHVETEEELAERELAEEMKRKRTAELAAVAAAASGGAGTGGSATAAVPAAASAAAAGGGGGGGGGGSIAGVRLIKAGGGGGSAGGGASGSGGPGSDKDYDLLIKLLLLGDGGVGKTSLMLRFSEDKFSSSLLATAGVDYKTLHLEVEGKRVKVQIWDTAGQQRFHTITQTYYKSAHGIILVYDESEPSEASFNNVRYWMDNITKHANALTQKILIGNKADVKGKKIEAARGRAMADEYGMKFFETSAKDGSGVKEAFFTVARDVALKMIAHEGGAVPGAAGGAAGGSAAGGKGDGKGGKDCTIM